jgi:hypothetical protein
MPRGRPKQQTPLERFTTNLSDAELLLTVADGFVNRRSNRMRSELREGLSAVLRVPKRDRERLELLESSHLWLLFKPGTPLHPSHLEDLSPLLRPAIVMACAALETLVADLVISHLRAALAADVAPKRLRQVTLSVEQLLDIRDRYERQQWGLRSAVERWIEREASTAPNKIGELWSTVGLDSGVLSRVDGHRKLPRGTTQQQLTDITKRRNRIAHAADRVKTRRATLTVAETRSAVDSLRDIGKALVAVTPAPQQRRGRNATS